MNLTPLKNLQKHTISKEQAYQEITTPTMRYKRARFIKMRIDIKDQKAISTMLNTLFAVPLPLGLIRPFIKRHKDENVRALAGMLDFAKGARIDIQSSEANIRISII